MDRPICLIPSYIFYSQSSDPFLYLTVSRSGKSHWIQLKPITRVVRVLRLGRDLMLRSCKSASVSLSSFALTKWSAKMQKLLDFSISVKGTLAELPVLLDITQTALLLWSRGKDRPENVDQFLLQWRMYKGYSTDLESLWRDILETKPKQTQEPEDDAEDDTPAKQPPAEFEWCLEFFKRTLLDLKCVQSPTNGSLMINLDPLNQSALTPRFVVEFCRALIDTGWVNHNSLFREWSAASDSRWFQFIHTWCERLMKWQKQLPQKLLDSVTFHPQQPNQLVPFQQTNRANNLYSQSSSFLSTNFPLLKTIKQAPVVESFVQTLKTANPMNSFHSINPVTNLLYHTQNLVDGRGKAPLSPSVGEIKIVTSSPTLNSSPSVIGSSSSASFTSSTSSISCHSKQDERATTSATSNMTITAFPMPLGHNFRITWAQIFALDKLTAVV